MLRKPKYDFGAYAPVFVDIDNDADLDLFVGGFNGRLAFLRNTGSSTNPVYALEEERFQNIDVGQYIRPSFGDVDVSTLRRTIADNGGIVNASDIVDNPVF